MRLLVLYSPPEPFPGAKGGFCSLNITNFPAVAASTAGDTQQRTRAIQLAADTYRHLPIQSLQVD